MFTAAPDLQRHHLQDQNSVRLPVSSVVFEIAAECVTPASYYASRVVFLMMQRYLESNPGLFIQVVSAADQIMGKLNLR